MLKLEFTTKEQPIIPDNPEEPTEGIVINIIGSDTIQKNKSATYTAQITQDGVIVDCKSVVWEVINSDGTENQYVTISTQTETTITLSASQGVGKYVKIIATLEDDEIIGEKAIQIVGLF